MKPTLIVYGSCQAEEVAGLARTMPAISMQYEILYLASFSLAGANKPQISEKQIKACRLLWEQFDNNNPFPHYDLLPPSAQQVMFPGIDLNCLWPFNTRDPLNAPATNLPFGRFPYGDRVVIDLMDQGLSKKEVIAAYDEAAHRIAPQLQRFLAIDTARHAEREAKCAVSIADHVIEQLAVVRPLWTHNHPTFELLLHLFGRLCAATWDNRIKSWEIEATRYRDPFTYHQMPIHRVVADTLSLSWWNAHTEHTMPGFSKKLRYDQYIEAYTDWRFARLAMARF